MRGAGAFLPAPPGVVVRAEVSSWGLVHVAGAPGTMPIDAPRNPIAASVHPSAIPETQTTNAIPDAWLPSIYIPLTDNMGPQAGAVGVRVRHTEDIPVPATWIKQVAKPGGGGVKPAPKLGGRGVTPSVRALPRWPSLTQPSPTGRTRWFV